MNIILSVGNQAYVGRAFFNQFSVRSDINIVEPVEDMECNYKECFSKWYVSQGEHNLTSFIPNNALSKSKTNILYVPYQAIPYLIVKDRYLQNHDMHYCIAILKETIETPIASKELYNFYLDSKFKPSFSLFLDYFKSVEENEFLLERFDDIYNQAKELSIPLVSDDIINYLPN